MDIQTVASRAEIPATDQWNLTSLYASPEAWERDFASVEANLGGFDDFRGQLVTSAETLRQCLEHNFATARILDRVQVYAHLVNDQDKTDTKGEALYQRAMTLGSKFYEKTSYIFPEIQAIDDATMNDFLATEALAPYRFYLEKTLRYKPHTASAEIEALLAKADEVLGASDQVFSQLNNADLRFGVVKKADGSQVELSHGNLMTFLNDPDRATRRAAFAQYYQAFEAHQYTLTATLGHALKRDWFYARTRNYPSCRAAALFHDNMPESVYDNLLATVKQNTPLMKRYLDIRQQVLGLEAVHFYDTYTPLVAEVEFHMGYEEAAETCLEALAPLGEDYGNTLREGLFGGWVDRYENRGKRSGAYSSGCYDSWPYILMNYQASEINSLYTLMHEAGHSMHSFYSRQAQPYHESGYTIFVAEVASIFNEALLTEHLLRKYQDDPKMHAYIVNREIENIRGSLFRQTMFADFEAVTHNLVEQDTPLTVDTLRGEYRKLVDTYFAGALTIDDELELEGFRIPHFYSAFYVYKYATGIAAAFSLAEDVLAQKPGAVENYRKFLTLGGSRYPLEELQIAGVDMTSGAPIENALGRFEKRLEQLETFLFK